MCQTVSQSSWFKSSPHIQNIQQEVHREVDDMYRTITSLSWNQLFKYSILIMLELLSTYFFSKRVSSFSRKSELIILMSKLKLQVTWKWNGVPTKTKSRPQTEGRNFRNPAKQNIKTRMIFVSEGPKDAWTGVFTVFYRVVSYVCIVALGKLEPSSLWQVLLVFLHKPQYSTRHIHMNKWNYTNYIQTFESWGSMHIDFCKNDKKITCKF